MRTRAIVTALREEERKSNAAASVHLAVEAAVKAGVTRRSLLLSFLVPLGYAPREGTAEDAEKK